MKKMTQEEREQLVDITKHVIACAIDIGRAIVEGGADNRIAALDHAEEIVDAIGAMSEAE